MQSQQHINWIFCNNYYSKDVKCMLIVIYNMLILSSNQSEKVCYNIFIYWQFCFFSFCFKWWLRACLVSIFKNYFLFLKKNTKNVFGKVGDFCFLCFLCSQKASSRRTKKNIYIFWLFFLFKKELFSVFSSLVFCVSLIWLLIHGFLKGKAPGGKEWYYGVFGEGVSNVVGFSVKVWAMLWDFWRGCEWCFRVFDDGVNDNCGLDWNGKGERKKKKYD